jgi:UDP-glucose 4-epimerase
LETVILRYFNVYGSREPTRGHYAPVIGLFKRQKAAGTPHTIVGSGTQKRDFTYIDDVVDASLLSLDLDSVYAYGEVFNIGSGKSISINEISEMIGGSSIRITARVGESVETRADIAKAKTILQYSSKCNIRDYINSY